MTIENLDYVRRSPRRWWVEVLWVALITAVIIGCAYLELWRTGHFDSEPVVRVTGPYGATVDIEAYCKQAQEYFTEGYVLSFQGPAGLVPCPINKNKAGITSGTANPWKSEKN